MKKYILTFKGIARADFAEAFKDEWACAPEGRGSKISLLAGDTEGSEATFATFEIETILNIQSLHFYAGIIGRGVSPKVECGVSALPNAEAA